MRLSLFALLTFAACTPPRVPAADVQASGYLPVPMAFLDRAAMGAMPNVGLSAMGGTGDRVGYVLQLEQLLYGSPVYLGVIDCGAASKTNGTASVPFNATGNKLCGKPLLIQPSAEDFILPVVASGTAVTAATGVDVLAKERVVILMTSATGSDATCFLGCITSGGAANLSVWELH